MTIATQRATTWIGSLAVHMLLLVVLVAVSRHVQVTPPEQQEPLIYVEPAPPPPLAAAPQAAAVPSTPEVSAPLPEPRPTPRSEPEVPIPKAKPRPRASPSAGAVPASEGGKLGGTIGGKAGGTIGGRGDEPISASEAASPPVVVSRVVPTYPALARTRGVEGQVVLRATVDGEGRVEPAVKVVKSIPLLDEAAIDALRRWRFRPGRDRQGRPIRVIVEVPVRFELH